MASAAMLERDDRDQDPDGREPRSAAELLSVVSGSQPVDSLPHAVPVTRLAGASPSSPNLWDHPKRFSSETHLATRSLRKSVSVDSFIAQRSSARLAPRSDGVQRNRDNASAHLQEPGSPQPEQTDPRGLHSHSSAMSLSGLLRSRVGRRRGANKAYATDNDTSAYDDSDIDKPVIASGTVKDRVRARFFSLKPNRASASGSEVYDVPQLPARSTSTSLSNLKGSNRSNSGISSKSTASSQEPAQITAKRGKRARSHSVGPPSTSTTSKLSKRLSFGNQIPQLDFLRKLSIAVVGPTGCGKSTFVRKGLKKHDLSDPESLLMTITAGGVAQNIIHTRRKARFRTQSNNITTLSIYELDSSAWNTGKDASLLSVWPMGLPYVDGIFVCYDESDQASFVHVLQLVAGYKAMGIPTLTIACKADLENKIPPAEVAAVIDPYSKLIEVTQCTDEGKRRMRKSVERLVKDIVATRSPSHKQASIRLKRQIASSVDLPLRTSPMEDLTLTVRTDVPVSSIDLVSLGSPSAASTERTSMLRSKSSPSASSPAKQSPTRMFSTREEQADRQKLRISTAYESDSEDARSENVTCPSSPTTKGTETFAGNSGPVSMSSSTAQDNTLKVTAYGNGSYRDGQKNLAPSSPWTTLEDLLEKLFYLAVSGDDPSFISHFFLTYRRFATPRSVLLGMQKRLNELRQSSSDVTLSCFAQMRICNLLEQWIAEYPSDFAAPDTHGALHAVVRHLLSYSHTLSYGCEFQPFLNILGTLHDEDAAWALKSDVSSGVESDTEVDSMFDAEPNALNMNEYSPASLHSPEQGRSSASEPSSSPRSSTRERRSSLPLNAMAMLKTPIFNAFHNGDERRSPSFREIVSKLHRAATALMGYEAELIANELTRRELELFLRIEPRDWLRHTFIPGKKDPNLDPIAKFNAHYNDVHEWAVSLILCHDKPKGRARQIEKLAEVAFKLRMLNNYSSLRAIVTAINQATYTGDQSMEIFRTKVDLHKKFLSCDILLRTTGAHQSYRMALRNTKGPCIPSLEVHSSDLRRANEGNADARPDDPLKINWAKYNMMGRFIASTTSYQELCVGPNGYKFTENRFLGRLLDVPVMDYEMQQSRMERTSDDDAATSFHGSSLTFGGSHSKEGSVIKRMLQWS